MKPRPAPADAAAHPGGSPAGGNEPDPDERRPDSDRRWGAGCTRLGRGLVRRAGLLAILFVLCVWRSVGAADAPATGAVAVITDPDQVVAMTTAERSIAHPVRLEGRVSFVDPGWRNFWLEKNGLSSYLLLSTNPPPLRQGERVRIEGTLVPAKGLDAAQVTVTALAPIESVKPLDAAGRIGDRADLLNRMVTVEAYVDAQRVTDKTHVHLSLIVDDQPVTGWVKPDDPQAPPHWAGSFIRMRGLYQARYDPTQTRMTIELWTGDQRDVTVLGSIADSPRFDLPVTPINEISRMTPGREVRIRGRAMTSEVGSNLIVRDETGQTKVQTVQQFRVPTGTEVDAVGKVALEDAQWIVRPALVRLAPTPPGPVPANPAKPTILEHIDQIRQLSVEEAAQGRPVEITGSVVWALPATDFFFLQDITGCIRVRFRLDRMDAPLRNKYLQIKGVTYNGGFAPAVQLEDYKDLGTMSEPPVREVSYDQAITGEQDGQLISMHGFYERTESKGTTRRVYATTPSGEIVGLLEAPVYVAPNPGSLIRIRGACEMVTDENGRIVGIRLLMLAPPVIEEDAPADFYDLPLRSIKNLRQLSTARDLTRVRVAGTVLHAVPGSHLYLQEGQTGLLVLSRDTAPLSPGDRVEAVGVLGWEGVRTVLRAAVYRKTGTGPPPPPEALENPARLSLAHDSRLVNVRGTLIDFIRRPGQPTRLTLQAGATLFEAVLDETAGTAPPVDLALGAGLDLTGVYRIVFDDSRQSRSFQLQLRSPADIVVYQRARIWTVQRALIIAAVLGGCTLLGLAWVVGLRRRVNLQTTQIRSQLERQAQLEAEVQRASRLESLGVLAGGIAHDFNNLLTIVIGHLGLAMLDERAMAAVGENLRDSQRGALRARDLTQQLLTFAKGGNPLRAAVSLPHVVRETTEFVLHGSNVRSEYDFDPELWTADVDRNQIAQVIQNLVLNAVQAMPRGGVVRISLHNEELAEGKPPALAAGRYLRLALADSGEGIKPDLVSRIFDPYFSTRRGGSGLGLATVYSIVKKHEGHIEVQSTPGRGTTFFLWLPATDARAAVSNPPFGTGSSHPLAGARPARVLLMDDEESIRKIGTAVLQHMNLEATAVAEGAEAVRAFQDARAAGRPFDLLILDLTIPGGMGGREAIAAIRAIDPEVPAIVSSGYSNDPVLAEFGRYGFQAMVSKPYEVEKLGATIRRLLANRLGFPDN